MKSFCVMTKRYQSSHIDPELDPEPGTNWPPSDQFEPGGLRRLALVVGGCEGGGAGGIMSTRVAIIHHGDPTIHVEIFISCGTIGLQPLHLHHVQMLEKLFRGNYQSKFLWQARAELGQAQPVLCQVDL